MHCSTKYPIPSPPLKITFLACETTPLKFSTTIYGNNSVDSFWNQALHPVIAHLIKIKVLFREKCLCCSEHLKLLHQLICCVI